MKHNFNIVLLLFIVAINISLVVTEIKSDKDALSWFNKFGYNPCFNSTLKCSSNLKSMLEDYQVRFHLKKTGKLDESTRKHMNRPRCGMPDQPSGGLLSLVQSDLKWSRSYLTYAINSYPTQLHETNVRYIIREAFSAWTDHISLDIVEVCSACQPNINIEFFSGDHGDRYAFDESGQTLAHAFFPENGQIHFNRDQDWTEGFGDRKANLFLVAVHEIGHALGLNHKDDEKSVMHPHYPVISKLSKSDILPQIDRYDIQNKYGRKQSSKTTRTKPTTKPKTTRYTTTKPKTTRYTTTKPKTTRYTKTKPKTTRYTKTKPTRRPITTTRGYDTNSDGRSNPSCRTFLDAAFDHPDGTFHTIEEGVLWRYLPNQHRWEDRALSFSTKYPDISRPQQIVAGVYSSRKKQIVLFTNTSSYHYSSCDQSHANHPIVKNLPRNLHNSIVGAIYYHSDIYIITKNTIRLYKRRFGFLLSRDRNLKEEFPGLDGSIKTAFTYKSLHHFFTTTGRLYVWDERLNTWQTKDACMETNWFACSNDHKVVPPPKHRDPHRYGHRYYNDYLSRL